jgi:hypothetical protein
LVVMKSFPSVNAAYQSEKANIGVSIASVYNKLRFVAVIRGSNLKENEPFAKTVSSDMA